MHATRTFSLQQRHASLQMGRMRFRALHACVFLCALVLTTTGIQCKPRDNSGAEQRQGLARALLSLSQLGPTSQPDSPAEHQTPPPTATEAATNQSAELTKLLEKLAPWDASVNGSWPVGDLLPNLTCKPHGIALAVVAVHGDGLWEQLMRWMAVANRNAYAAHHGYSVYVSTAQLHKKRVPTWQKFLLARAAFQHSCPEYVWLLDSDAFIMNIGLSLEEALPEIFSKPPEQRPDVVVAKDCNGLNAGSLLLRHTPWTLQHLADAWAATWVNKSGDWFEQAALMHLTKTYPEVAAHYMFVPQRAINSYPKECGNCSTGPYEEGDLVLHFVEDSKHRELNLKSEYLNRIPILGPEEHATSSGGHSSSTKELHQHHTRNGMAASSAVGGNSTSSSDTTPSNSEPPGSQGGAIAPAFGVDSSDSTDIEGGNATEGRSSMDQDSGTGAKAATAGNLEQHEKPSDSSGSTSDEERGNTAGGSDSAGSHSSSITTSSSSSSGSSSRHRRHHAYGIWPADADLTHSLAAKQAHGDATRVRVELKSRLDAFDQHAEAEDYVVLGDPFIGNPGWPVLMPKLLRSVLAASHRHGHGQADGKAAGSVRQQPEGRDAWHKAGFWG